MGPPSLAEQLLRPPGTARHDAPFGSFSGTTARLVLAVAPDHLREPRPEQIHPADPWARDLDQPTLVDERGTPWATYEPPTACRRGIDVPEILGFGPVDPVTARGVAADPPRWLSVSTLLADTAGVDDVADTAGVTDTADTAEPGRHASTAATSRYRPGARLARLVRTLHPTCVAPACTVPSTACDLDHVVAWPDGTTSVENLRPLCRHHHVLKTHDGHRYDVTADGSTVWVTPLGYAYRRATGGESEFVGPSPPSRAPEARAAA